MFSKASGWLKKTDNRARKHPYAVYYGGYTVIFLIMILAVFSWFGLSGKSLVWEVDGLYQHYNSLLYYSDYLKTIISGLFSEGQLEVPLWDFNIGLGADVVQSLHYYVMGDPLTIFAVFVPRESMETFYGFLIFLRFYLAGLSFSLYAFRMKLSRYQALTGALVYVFCGFALGLGIRHPYFMNPMIYFPIILIGIEKIFKKEKPFLFIISTCVAALSSFYFFYMLTILMFLYALVRFFHYREKPYGRSFFQHLGKFTLYYVTGMLMAGVLLWPLVREVITGGRVGSGSIGGIFYDLIYYVKFWIGLTSIRWVGNGGFLAYTGLTLIACVALMLTGRKSCRQLKAGLLIGLILLMLPAGGYILHGFSYVSNRWVWGFSFVTALITAWMLPQIINPTTRLLRWTGALIGVYTVPFILVKQLRTSASPGICIILLAFFGVMLAAYRIQQNDSIKRKWMPLVRGTFTGLVLINILVVAGGFYSPEGDDYVGEFHDRGSTLEQLTANPTIAVAEAAGDEIFYRYEEATAGESANYNTGLQTDIHGMSFYYSVANKYITQYMDELENNISRSFKYVGMDGRAALHTLASGRYFLIEEGQESYLPYGYEELRTEYEAASSDDKTGQYAVYENQYWLPLGYTYSNWISEEQYQQLDAIQRQNAMLQAVVLPESGLAQADEVVLDEQEIDFETELSEGIEVQGDRYVVTREAAFIELTFDQPANSELYLRLEGFTCELADQFSEVSRAAVAIKAEDVRKQFSLMTEADAFYEGKSDFAFNMGYSEEGKSTIRITFNTVGTYTLEAIHVICQQMDNYADQVNALREDVLEELEIGTNQISGMITLQEEKILCLSIPYSQGWSAQVDGEPAELLQANTMYMALELEPGTHEVVLYYETPGLKAGAKMSVIGILLFLGVVIWERRDHFMDRSS